jgi:hypothetical protein
VGGVGQHVAGGAQQVLVREGGAAADSAARLGGCQSLAGAGDDELADEFG